MITFTEQERAFLWSSLNDLYQNWNVRSLEGDLLHGMLVKLRSTTVSFTEQESRRIQYQVQDLKDLYSRIADIRSQHLIQGGAGRMSTCGSNQQVGIAAGGATGDCGFFNGPKTYDLCISILNKLVGS